MEPSVTVSVTAKLAPRPHAEGIPALPGSGFLPGGTAVSPEALGSPRRPCTCVKMSAGCSPLLTPGLGPPLPFSASTGGSWHGRHGKAEGDRGRPSPSLAPSWWALDWFTAPRTERGVPCSDRHAHPPTVGSKPPPHLWGTAPLLHSVPCPRRPGAPTAPSGGQRLPGVPRMGSHPISPFISLAGISVPAEPIGLPEITTRLHQGPPGLLAAPLFHTHRALPSRPITHGQDGVAGPWPRWPPSAHQGR